MVELGGEEAASAEMGWKNRVPKVKSVKQSAESTVRSEYRYSRWTWVGKMQLM